PDEPLKYRFDDEWLSLEERIYKAKVKIFAGIKIPVKQKIYHSVYGPTFETDDGFYAWRFVVAQDIRSIEQWYQMNKADDFASFKSALDMQAIPCTNIIYADRAHNIFFISNAKVPIRSENYQWREVVPGNTPTTLWDTYYPLDSLPQVLNPAAGYVYNTNNTPFSASDIANNPQEGASNGMMTFQHADMENARSLRLQELMAQYDQLSYQDFKTIKYDLQYGDSITHRDMMNLDLVFQLSASDYLEQGAIINELQVWNRAYDVDNTRAPLFIYFIKTLTDQLKEEDRLCWRCQITAADVVVALTTTQNYFMAKYGSLSVRLGDFQRHIRGDVNLPLPGGPDVLAAMYSVAQKDGTFKGVAGESYIQLVQFSAEGVQIETVNAYGSSANPDSPHYTDQMELFVKQQLKPMTLDKAKVLEEAVRVYHPRKVIEY
ncbi:MAG: penicillin acylase family protein, partial [Bacteroidota bacterium]